MCNNENDDDPLDLYSTEDILYDYKLLVQDFPSDDEHLSEMRAILVSRHRFLNAQETADAPSDWSGGLIDSTKYFVSASLIFEVDKALYEFYGSLEGILRQAIPVKYDALEASYGVISATTKWRYLIGLVVNVVDVLCYEITGEVARKIIDALLQGGTNEN